MDERTLNDLLECSVCLDRLDTSSKVLPCQHTFCRKCLEVILSSRQELRCPECRVLVDIKIDDLPPNVLLMRILEGMKNAAAAAKTTQQEQQVSPKIQNDNKIENTLKLNEDQQQQIKLKQQQLLFYQQQQNKQKQKQHMQALHQHQLQQQHQQQQMQLSQTQQQQQHTTAVPQQRRLLPHAYALYDFESSESNDLHFKKGDIILLKRKVDINWFVGELNGVEGTFPTNYVQVIVPLPSPQCIALYDFKMGPNEEEGCLTFKKGTLIHVLRRVDHNWAEGRISSTIGIFPIAFVELNPLAKQLLDSFVVLNSPPPPPIVAQYQQQQQLPQQQAAPPQVPANQQATVNTDTQQTQPRNLPPIPVDASTPTSTSDTPTSSSSCRSSQSTSNTTSSCSSVSSSLPSSPQQSNPTSPQNSCGVRYRDCKEKRHSLNALLSDSAAAATGGGATAAGTSLSIVQSSNRHSAEILSIPTELSSAQNMRMSSANDNAASDTASSTAAAQTKTPLREQQKQQLQQQQNLLPAMATSRANVLKTANQQSVPPSLPWGYLALYPYKPRKSDELELKKGCVYVVTERCLDGWFKGKNWQDISGVFPGNYVTPLRNRDQQQLMHQWKYVQNQPPIQQATLSNTPTTAAQSKLHVNTNTMNHAHHPPELPPRQSPSASPVAGAAPSTTSNYSASVWSKPLGHTVEAFFTRKSHNAQESPQDGVNSTATARDKEREKQKDNSTNAVSGASSSSASSAAVSLMKRLTQIKTRSKSPNNSAATALQTTTQQPVALGYSMDNPSFEDAPVVVGTAHIKQAHASNMHPVHVRSGSCPSQLLQSLPVDFHATSQQSNEKSMTTHQHKQQQQQHQHPTSQPIYGGSQRVKGCKERPQLSNARQSADSTLRGIFNNFNSTTTQQQQHQAFTKCAQQAQQQKQQQQQQQQGLNNIAIHHRKSQSLDTNNMTAQMVPTNSSQSSTDAARAGSAAQNTRESRFRCIVSYPPNSELELDLNVGDVVYVHRKQKNGWYKGTHARTNKTGLFPASFVEPDI